MLTKEHVRAIRRHIADDDRLPVLFDALSDPTRYKIFKLLLRHQDLCVTDIANVLDISLPATSQQLRVMELSGLVIPERMGQMICYTVRKDDPAVTVLARIIAGRNPALRREKGLLKRRGGAASAGIKPALMPPAKTSPLKGEDRRAAWFIHP